MNSADRARSALRRFVLHHIAGRRDLDALRRRGLRVGADTFVDPDALLDVDFCWLIALGDRCTTAPRVTIIAHDATTKRATGFTRLGRVRIGSDTFIGAGAVILPGVTVGAGAIVGAGSVVRSDVPPGVLVTGDPADVREDVSAYLARQRSRMGEDHVHREAGFAPRAGLASPINRAIARELEHHRTVFVP